MVAGRATLATRLAAEGVKLVVITSISPEFRGDGKVDAMAVEPEAITTTKCDVLPPDARGAILDDDIVIAGTAARPGAKAAV